MNNLRSSIDRGSYTDRQVNHKRIWSRPLELDSPRNPFTLHPKFEKLHGKPDLLSSSKFSPHTSRASLKLQIFDMLPVTHAVSKNHTKSENKSLQTHFKSLSTQSTSTLAKQFSPEKPAFTNRIISTYQKHRNLIKSRLICTMLPKPFKAFSEGLIKCKSYKNINK